MECHGYYYDECYEWSQSYSDLCVYESDVENSEDYTDDYGSWCGTNTAAIVSLLAMIGATTFVLVGTVHIKCDHCCCKWNVNIWFRWTGFCCLVSILVWTIGDERCLGTYSSLDVGATMYCNIVAIIFTFIMIIITRNIRKQEMLLKEAAIGPAPLR